MLIELCKAFEQIVLRDYSADNHILVSTYNISPNCHDIIISYISRRSNRTNNLSHKKIVLINFHPSQQYINIANVSQSLKKY